MKTEVLAISALTIALTTAGAGMASANTVGPELSISKTVPQVEATSLGAMATSHAKKVMRVAYQDHDHVHSSIDRQSPDLAGKFSV